VFDGNSVWNSASYFFNPATIAAGDWTGVPADREIPANGLLHDLLLIYNFSVTGGQTFTLDARWDNGSGASFCNSNSVTVIR
jgi:hypothetical protein